MLPRRASAGIWICGPNERRFAALRGIVRSLRTWDGGPTWWTADVEGLPTTRQLDLVWQVVDGRSTAEIADELVLSKRTVENHLHRASRALGVSGREELVATMRPLERPDGWVPTRQG